MSFGGNADAKENKVSKADQNQALHRQPSELWEDARDTSDLLTSAAIALDKACVNEILGRVLFEGENGKFYSATVEAVIRRASKAFVKEVLQEIEKDIGVH